jgi:outer membrane protein assembly factor BamB
MPHLTRLALSAYFVASCSYFSSPGNFEPFTADHQREAPPESIIELRFSAALVPEDWKTFRPEEVAAVGTSPDHGQLYIGVRTGMLFCLKAANGKKRWEFETNGAITTKPIQPETSETLFFASDDGNLYSLSARDGSLRWKQPLKAAAESELAVSNGLVVARLSNGSVMAFSQKTGETVWTWLNELPDGFTIDGVSAPKISRGKVLIGTAGGELFALDLASGREIWSSDLTAGGDQFLDIDTTPLIDQNLIYVASYSGGVYAVSSEDGQIVWRQALSGVVGLARNKDGPLFAVSAEQRFYSLSSETGEVKLSAAMPTEPRGITYQEPYLFVSTRTDGLWILDRFTGKLVQRYDTGNGIRALPTVEAASLYMLSNGGRLYAFELPRDLEEHKKASRRTP